ncbi:bifunctional oligoribonuclease/PAP phosphatase NrnA [Jejudonia soesokkakensis]|uniref:Bifunctional oligoribonuclease/PAP phosphatase NrnA n=1 Tax=Jejudonia soesokkakensis TaxID=1323432 RepID=A0ABW2MRJ8_9FLAO
MDTQTTAIVKELLSETKKIVIVGHKNPDADAIGSCLGLSEFLKTQGHVATVLMPNTFPDFLKWMPGSENILTYDQQPEQCEKFIDEAQVIFTLDFNALNRVGDLETPLKSAKAEFVMIDHHQQPDSYPVATYSDTSMSSTCEMVYHFIDALEQLDSLSETIATNLYTGIMTDTGSFRFSSTSATTHRVIADLIDHGAVNNVIHESIYDTNSPDRMTLLGVALKNLTILPEYKTAFISLSQKELDDNNFKKGDTEGFVNYALSIQGIIFAVIFIENKQENIVKMSLRSKGNFSVNEFARTYYNGGGHTNAAGGRSTKPLDDTITEFISILPHHKDALVNA